MRLGGKTCWFLVLAGLFSCSAQSLAQDVMLVANPSLQLLAITSSDVRAIFLGTKTRLADGAHASPVTLKGGPAHEVFLKNHLGESPEEFRAQWRKTVFTGQGAMPRAFDSEAELLHYVATTPGTLGYVSRISPADKVKQIMILK